MQVFHFKFGAHPTQDVLKLFYDDLFIIVGIARSEQFFWRQLPLFLETYKLEKSFWLKRKNVVWSILWYTLFGWETISLKGILVFLEGDGAIHVLVQDQDQASRLASAQFHFIS